MDRIKAMKPFEARTLARHLPEYDTKEENTLRKAFFERLAENANTGRNSWELENSMEAILEAGGADGFAHAVRLLGFMEEKNVQKHYSKLLERMEAEKTRVEGENSILDFKRVRYSPF